MARATVKNDRPEERATVSTSHYDSPLGGITLSSDGKDLTGLWFDGQRHFPGDLPPVREGEEELPVFGLTKKWLDVYFSGREPSFRPPLTYSSTLFRVIVWNALRDIPYGRTMTYGEFAGMLAKTCRLPRMSARAVGGAVGFNPISLIVPCHRVVGSNGSLTGYAGGIWRKRRLLELEGVDLSRFREPKEGAVS